MIFLIGLGLDDENEYLLAFDDGMFFCKLLKEFCTDAFCRGL